ncbi:MAG TPA: stalk domain-containing protein, partial [Bacillus sp. (in: firmicutes)]|nr:stalk domain-containing protein [Bacillus sp. (in: firmicutes)]
MTNLVVETNKNSKRKRILLGFLIVLFVMISSILLFLYPFASKEKVNYFTGENPILFQGKQEGNALSMENGIYIPIEFLKEQIDENIFYDEPSKAIIITTKNKVIYMPIDSLTYFVNEEPIQLKMPS